MSSSLEHGLQTLQLSDEGSSIETASPELHPSNVFVLTASEENEGKRSRNAAYATLLITNPPYFPITSYHIIHLKSWVHNMSMHTSISVSTVVGDMANYEMVPDALGPAAPPPAWREIGVRGMPPSHFYSSMLDE